MVYGHDFLTKPTPFRTFLDEYEAVTEAEFGQLKVRTETTLKSQELRMISRISRAIQHLREVCYSNTGLNGRIFIGGIPDAWAF